MVYVPNTKPYFRTFVVALGPTVADPEFFIPVTEIIQDGNNKSFIHYSNFAELKALIAEVEKNNGLL